MDLREEKVGEVTIVNVGGRLDAATSKPTEERILQLIDGGVRKLVLDLSDLEYISSVGLRVLITTVKRLKSVNGKVTVCCLQESIQQIFEIAGFTSILQVHPSRDAAVAAVS